jgi:hypothetical protein
LFRDDRKSNRHGRGLRAGATIGAELIFAP